MNDFQLSPEVDSNKIFLIQRSELEGRLDPSSYSMKNTFMNSIFPLQKLSDFFIINPTQKEKISDTTSYSFIPMENISDKNATVIKTNSIMGIESKGYTHFNDGDFLFSKITPCMENGKMAIVRNLPTKIGFGSTEFHVFREKTKTVRVDFLKSIFLIDDFRKYAKFNFTGTAGHRRVPPEFFKSLKIPIPPKEIQEKIVAKMDTAYTAKKEKEAEAQRLLAGIDDYLLGELGIKLPQQKENIIQSRIFKRKLSEVSGGRFDPYYYKPTFKNILKCVIKGKYIATKLSDIAIDIKNGVEIRTYAKDGIRYLRVTDLGKYSINSDSPRYVTIDSIPEKIRLTKNCILISRSGSLGLINVVESHIMNAILSSHIFKVELDSSIILPDYAEAFLRSKCGQLEIFKENNGGVIPEINQSGLKNLKIPLPPLSKQTEIADHITALRTKAKQLQQQAKAGLEQAKTEVEAMILGKEEKKI